MICINCPAQQDYVKDVLANSTGEIQYTFEKKDGIRLFFSVNTEDIDAACAAAKAAIKASPLGSALYFQVTGA